MLKACEISHFFCFLSLKLRAKYEKKQSIGNAYIIVPDPNELTVYNELRKKQAKKRKRQSNSISAEPNKPRGKKKIKTEIGMGGSRSDTELQETIPDEKMKLKRITLQNEGNTVEEMKKTGELFSDYFCGFMEFCNFLLFSYLSFSVYGRFF